MISPSLKERVLKHIFSDILKKNELFGENESLVKFVTRKLDTRILLPEYSVINQGEKGENLYFIAKGECTVAVTDHKGIKNYTNPPLRTGAVFGEIALLTNSDRTASVKTSMYSTIALLHKKDFGAVCRIYSDFYMKLKAKMKTYKDNLKMFLKELIQNVDYMGACCDDTIEEISYYCQQAFCEKDTVVFRAGDSIDKIYFILNGKVNIMVNINGIDIVVDTLYQGCSIG